MPNPPAATIPHGTLDYAEMRALNLRPEDLTLFSSNINPFGPPPATIAALSAATNSDLVARYPDRLSLELREALAAYHKLPVDSILAGNGSADLIWLIGLIHLQGRRVAILGPTFGEYRHIAHIMQAEVSEISHPGWLSTANGFEIGTGSLQQVAAEVQQCAPEVIFFCNPNNPTGHYLAPSDLEILYAAAPQALWIIDEAYAEFMQPAATTAAWTERGNWLVLRSMTKDFALGGLRLGYMLGAPALIQPLQRAQPPWNVNTFAQLAGTLSIREGLHWRSETIARLSNETVALQERLRQVGYRPYPTRVNYFLLPVDDAASVRHTLLSQRLVVRDCTSFGLPHFIRIATQLPAANQRLVQALSTLAASTQASPA